MTNPVDDILFGMINPVDDILLDIKRELEKAKQKHPFFPMDTVWRCAIMMEEAGEAVQAANDVAWEDGDKESLKLELLHTAAMCVRILEAMIQEEDDEQQ